jgi:hypothetical protein
MNNRLKEFEELLLDNTLLKVQNQALGDKIPKWKEWWQIIQEFKEEQIQESMELARLDEESYQLELHAYQTAFLDFKYKLPNFVSTEIGTSNRAPTTPFVVQLVAITKPISPLKGGTSLEITPLHVQIFTILIWVAIITIELMRASETSAKEHAKPIDPSFTILNSRI